MEDNKKEEVIEEVTENENDVESPKKKSKKSKVDITKEPAFITLQEENAKLLDQLLRKQAEFENYKKRVAEERQRERKYALQDFLMESIETLDILDKAVCFKTEDQVLKNFLSGFIMINNRLKQILEHYEVKQIDALNKPFDPSFHSAIEAIKVDGVEPNTVVEVIITGYTYKDRVLRPSMVKVSE